MVEKSHTSGFWPSLYDPLRQLGERVSDVCRQGFWNQWQLKLRESLAHLVGFIMRRAVGDASAVLRVSFV